MTPRMFWLLFFIVIILLALLGCDRDTECEWHKREVMAYDDCMADFKCVMTHRDYASREREARLAMQWCPPGDVEDAQ